ncbi:MAG: hypothetical protein D6814_07905 [Calditrichaeota bacterium]|nr:MAG: hypothetical protein D6814_07905 [Calditrichota bacterium]
MQEKTTAKEGVERNGSLERIKIENMALQATAQAGLESNEGTKGQGAKPGAPARHALAPAIFDLVNRVHGKRECPSPCR